MISLNPTVNKLTMNATIKTGVVKRKKLIPPDFIAVISLLDDKRPNARSDAKSIDIGNVNTMMAGKLKMKSFVTAVIDAPYSVIYCAIRNSVLEPMNTLQNAHIPKTNGPNNSFMIYLSNIRIPFSLHTQISGYYILKFSPK